MSSQISTSSTSIAVAPSTRSLNIVCARTTLVEVEHLLLDLASDEGANVGIVVNTVASAIRLYDHIVSLLGADVVTLAHSRFIAVDRMVKDAELLRMLGKEAQRTPGEMRVVIGTQVIEQSLDIDFDIMVSELAPTLYILQRAGRLHRHSSKTRTPKTQQPRLLIIEPDGDIISTKGSSFVYGEYPLMQAGYVIDHLPSAGHIRLPGDITPLVALDEGIHLPEWDGARDAHNNEVEARAARAKAFRVGSLVRADREGIFGWLSGGTDTEIAGEAKVRDGVSGPTVVAVFTDDDGVWVPSFTSDSRREPYYIPLNAAVTSAEVRKVAASTVTLPRKFNSLVHELEMATLQILTERWNQDRTLKGEVFLAFRLDNNLWSATVGDSTLTYDPQIGLA